MELGIETETLSFTKLNMFERERERQSIYIIKVKVKVLHLRRKRTEVDLYNSQFFNQYSQQQKDAVLIHASDL